MRAFVLLFTIVASMLALTWSAAIGQAENENIAGANLSLLDVDAGVDHNKEIIRQARQFGPYAGGFGRPYGGYGGGFGRPYGGYGGGPYYGGYGRPFGGYGGFGGFGGPYGGFGYYG